MKFQWLIGPFPMREQYHLAGQNWRTSENGNLTFLQNFILFKLFFRALFKIITFFEYFFKHLFVSVRLKVVHLQHDKKTEVVMFKRRFKRVYQVAAINAPATKIF